MNKTQSRAHRAIRQEVEMGRIAKKSRCQRCGEKERRCADGRSSIQAHHPDYSKPLEVIWLCPGCHRRITPLACGERSGVAKLTVIKVEAIKALSHAGWGVSKLSCAFDVNRSTIERVLDGTTWLKTREAS